MLTWEDIKSEISCFFKILKVVFKIKVIHLQKQYKRKDSIQQGLMMKSNVPRGTHFRSQSF